MQHTIAVTADVKAVCVHGGHCEEVDQANSQDAKNERNQSCDAAEPAAASVHACRDCAIAPSTLADEAKAAVPGCAFTRHRSSGRHRRPAQARSTHGAVGEHMHQLESAGRGC